MLQCPSGSPVNEGLETGDFLLVSIEYSLCVTYAFIPLDDPLHNCIVNKEEHSESSKEEMKIAEQPHITLPTNSCLHGVIADLFDEADTVQFHHYSHKMNLTSSYLRTSSQDCSTDEQQI
jgi:hypothetical protein